MKRMVLCAFFAAFGAILVSLSLSGCVVVHITDRNTVRGEGDLEPYEISTGRFSSISVEGTMEIHYYSAERNYITLEVQPNLRDYIVVEVIDGNFTIRPTRRINFAASRTPVLTVSTPVLEGLSVSGACTFTAHDTINADSFSLRVSGVGEGRARLDVESLHVNISGAGSFDLSGRADIADLRLSGTGHLRALPLQSREAVIRLSGTGSVGISCSESLGVTASGAGSVEYRGSPSLNLDNSGRVSVRRVE